MNELPPLTRLLMVAEWLDSAATYQDRPGAMDEHEANATVLRQVHTALLAASDAGGRGEHPDLIDVDGELWTWAEGYHCAPDVPVISREAVDFHCGPVREAPDA